MSRIPFLDNASQGKNNWWRYLLTIFLTWVVPIVLGIVAIIFIFIFVELVLGENPLEQMYPGFVPILDLLFGNILYVGFFLFLYLSVRFIHKRKFISLINTASKVNWRRLLKGAGIWFIILAILEIINLIIDPYSVKITFNQNTFIFLLIISLLTFPIQASFEELFFRGYLMQGIGLLTKKPLIPILITSVIFAIIHYWNGTSTISSVDIVLQIFIFGLTMSIITLGENGLETAMGVHISNNLFVAVISNPAEGGFEGIPSILTVVSKPEPILDTIVSIILAIVLIIIIFWNKRDNLYNVFKNRHMKTD